MRFNGLLLRMGIFTRSIAPVLIDLSQFNDTAKPCLALHPSVPEKLPRNRVKPGGRKKALFGTVALLDAAKGSEAAWAGLALTGSPLWGLLARIAAVRGHSFSFWIRFKGGKSVLTAFGVFLFLSPLASLGALLLWAAVMAMFNYVSLASIIAAAGLPLLILIESRPGELLSPVFWAALPVCEFVIIRLRANIGRLWRGEEPKFRGKARQAA